jgi:serine/threonine-protein kinase
VLKVADFGIARVDRTDLTQVGMLIGTPLYMSPEQCRGLDVDARSDLFSTGVVLYELLTGEKPFRGNMEQITYKICHEEPEPPSRLSKLRLPSAVDHLISTALAKQPAARFQDAHAFRDSLREVAQLSVEVEDGAGTTMMAIGTLRLQKPAPAWDEETLATAEHELARALGPMAKVIVHRAAAQASDRAELCSILSDSIIDPDTRRQFVAAFERTGGTGGGGVRTGGGTGSSQSAGQSRPRTGGHASISGAEHASGTDPRGPPLDQAYIDQITARLAVYIGPIAPIVTKKAARDARGRREFLRRVADNLGTQERIAFLHEVGLPDR